MLEVSGYSSLKLLKNEGKTALYRCFRVGDNKPVILKKIITEPPALDDLKRLHEEYDLLTKLPVKDVPKPLEFIDNGKQAAYALEDDGEVILSQYLKKQAFTIEQFLSVAISLTEVISDLHFRDLTHKDIKPANILVNLKKKSAKIINFESISFPWHAHSSDLLRGTLAYISPEQTGRMNRPIDYRTDFYSLGVTFYEMLTGEVPFESQDAIGMVHAHIAKSPDPPININTNIPMMINNIVLKLLAKIPEERYQSAYGLKKDLQKCLKLFKNKGEITEFPLAKQDVSEHFVVTHKLYGREKELEILHKSFDESRTGKFNLIFVTGYAGIGKSTLVNEIYKPVAAHMGYYCSAKFEQYQRDIPYSAFINLLKNLVKQILTENETKLQYWRKAIEEKLGSNISIITNFVPEIELIVGHQPSLQINSENAEILFYRVVKDFIQVFAAKSHPLVLFIDDMQWSSYSTLKLLEYLINSDVKNLLIIGAYRANEVTSHHPVANFLEDAAKLKSDLQTINLTPLTLYQTQQLIADSLYRDVNAVTDLAKLCFEKTQGNPFFINQLLKMICEEKLISYDPTYGRWKWDIKEIKRLPVTSNVVDLMLRSLERFPDTTKNLLKLASCIGNSFSLSLLTLISNSTAIDVISALRPALDEGYILPSDGEMQFSDKSITSFIYKFLHDRVHQAAYELIDDEHKKIIHKKIGQALTQRYSPMLIKQNIFYIVNHLNAAIDLMTTPNEKIELAKLNLLAGKKAKESVAFKQSLINLETGVSLLGDSAWSDHYSLALSLHNEAAYVAYLTNNHETMENLSDSVYANARNVLDTMKIYETRIDAYTKYDKCNKAIRISKEALKKLDIDIPNKFKTFQLLKNIFKLQFISLIKSQKDILNLPELKDKRILAAVRILVKTLPAAQSKSVTLLALYAVKTVLLSIRHGNTTISAIAYVMCALVFWKMGNIKNMHKFGQLSLLLVNKFPVKRERGMALFTSNAFIQPWIGPLRDSLPGLFDSFKIAVDLGEISYIGYNAFFHSVYQFWSGADLETTLNDTTKFLKAVEPYKQNIPVYALNLLLQWIDNLRNNSVNPLLLDGEYMKENEWLEFQSSAKNKLQMTAFYLVKMHLYYLLGRYKEAFEYLNKIKLEYFEGMYSYSMVLFFGSLIRLANYNDLSDKDKKINLNLVRENQKLYKKLVKSASINFLDKYYLVTAEYARVTHKFRKAIKFYDLAIEHAHKNHLLQEEAIANELSGLFYLEYNKKIAPTYFQDAYYAYKKWGAKAKVAQLLKLYPGLIFDIASNEQKNEMTAFPQSLDLSSILKASQVISAEINLDTLVQQTLKIVVENMGADRCVLLLERNRELFIEGEYSKKGKFLHMLDSIPYAQSRSLPTSIVDYVKRTKEMVKIDNVAHDKLFLHDAYLMLEKPRSILCTPLIQHGELQGIFYFENNIAINAFTNSRLQLLNSLSSQIAISIENARLYESFKRFVPQEFLNILEKHNVVDVQPGDSIQKVISVLFMDITGFTALSERLSPEEIFQFINTYLGYMEPVIALNKGFIDKYIGDGLMALFPECADNAIKAAIALQQTIADFNLKQLKDSNFKVSARIGINTGASILGTIGSKQRIDGSVIGDAVNTASRITDLNDLYGATVLMSEHTRLALNHPNEFCMRRIDKVKVKGKAEVIPVWEILLDIESEDVPMAIDGFSHAWEQYAAGNFKEAKKIFHECLKHRPQDKVCEYFIRRCDEFMQFGAPKDWEGVTTITSKIHF